MPDKEPIPYRVVFKLIDWANSPRMLQMELERPWRYRAMVWPPMVGLVVLVSLFILWGAGVF